MTIKFRAKTKVGFTVDSPLTPFNFPDGQATLKGTENFDHALYEYHIADIRGLNPQDLDHAALWSATLDKLAPGSPKVLFLPYLPGARSDHSEEDVFAAAMYADKINNLWVDQVILLDPHSQVMPHLINGDGRGGVDPTEFPFERIIRREIQDHTSDSRPAPYMGVIAPDHGAVDRATRAAKVMGVPVYKAGKTRDPETGKLSGFHMEDELPTEGKLLIVDDICDGGGTFIGLAEATGLDHKRVDLWVTHGIFSKGTGPLIDAFGEIHTTDSYFGTREDSTIHPNHVTVHKIIPYLTEAINV
jgi:ribose-phosphate pyrophosphokinase